MEIKKNNETMSMEIKKNSMEMKKNNETMSMEIKKNSKLALLSSCLRDLISSTRSSNLKVENSDAHASTSKSGFAVEVVSTNTDSEEGGNDSKDNTLKKKRKLNYNQKFRQDWLSEFKWLNNSSSKSKLGQSFCKVCNKTLTNNYSHLKRHELNKYHEKKMKAAKISISIPETLLNHREPDNLKTQKECELKMLAFIAEHNLPLKLMDHLPAFVKNLCQGSKIIKNVQCGRTKANLITKYAFANERIAQISEKMRKSFYSLIIDETTDLGTVKSLVIVVRFVDNYKAKDHFLALTELESANAESITEPKIAYSGDIPSLTKLLNCFPVLKDKVNIEELNLEWRSIPDLKEMKTHLDDIETFWSLLLCQKDDNNDFQFPNLIIVTTYVFSLPHSSASAERMFSQLFLMKTKPRNRRNITYSMVVSSLRKSDVNIVSVL
ncbi:unnamed protein product [Psylliodes chrysocephalus]|uniref:HAT C-terminal dimerisation domain-containing protein n=1 Tax=Psylliodes chrysocephalus TaxID=3402493 RepID=A0A9P0DDC2_9CUCU|nr:unnamed protein product [Psylliodes chrysocephala]